ncbi:MAG: gliding motility lipoprotein GldD [Bacteroidales bacterium]
MIEIKKIFVLYLFVILFFTSCLKEETMPMPKPFGYMRIALPEKEYKWLDTVYPFKFSYPAYAILTPYHGKSNEENAKYWFNITIPRFNAYIYFTYKEIQNNLFDLKEDSRTFVVKHISKSSNIENILINKPEKKVYGVIYEIEGNDVASPLQFFLTDSTKHYLRGALYFNNIPNNDSLKPIIDFLKIDIDTLINTFSWK